MKDIKVLGIDLAMVGGWFEQQKLYLNKNPHSEAFMVDESHSIWIQKPEKVCEQIKKLSNY